MRTAVAAAAAAASALVATGYCRTIHMLGPQELRIEAGLTWNDASCCNSRRVVNQIDRKLKYCAYYEDMKDVEDNPPLAGIPMDCYDGCQWDEETHSCIYESNEPGEYRFGQGCNVRAESSLLQCQLQPEELCRSALLVTTEEDGIEVTTEVIRGADATSEPTRISVRLNPGSYALEFGTINDTCVAMPNCDPTIAPCSGKGPCIRMLHLTDTEAPKLALLPFCTFAPDETDEICSTDAEVSIVQGSIVDDLGADANDLVDGHIEHSGTTCPTDTASADVVCTFFEQTNLCGHKRQTCTVADTVSRQIEVTTVGNQTLFYVAVDGVGNIRAISRHVQVTKALVPNHSEL